MSMLVVRMEKDLVQELGLESDHTRYLGQPENHTHVLLQLTSELESFLASLSKAYTTHPINAINEPSFSKSPGF